MYELAGPTPGMGGVLGACHGLDVPLVFGNQTNGQPAMLFGDDLTEAAIVSAQMRGAWTTFATDGDPGRPAYDRDKRLSSTPNRRSSRTRRRCRAGSGRTMSSRYCR